MHPHLSALHQHQVLWNPVQLCSTLRNTMSFPFASFSYDGCLCVLPGAIILSGLLKRPFASTIWSWSDYRISTQLKGGVVAVSALSKSSRKQWKHETELDATSWAHVASGSDEGKLTIFMGFWYKCYILTVLSGVTYIELQFLWGQDKWVKSASIRSIIYMLVQLCCYLGYVW